MDSFQVSASPTMKQATEIVLSEDVGSDLTFQTANPVVYRALTSAVYRYVHLTVESAVFWPVHRAVKSVVNRALGQ